MPLRSGEGISGWCAHAAATRWGICVSVRDWPARKPPKRGKMAHSCECAELARTHAAATRWRTRTSARSWPTRQPPKRGKMAHSCECAELARTPATATHGLRPRRASQSARNTLTRATNRQRHRAKPCGGVCAGPQKFHMQITLVLQQSILKCDILIGVDAVSEGEANAVEHSDSG